MDWVLGVFARGTPEEGGHDKNKAIPSCVVGVREPD